MVVIVLVTFFAIKYRRRHPDEEGVPIHGSLALELIWTGIPFILAMVMFVWGASVYFALARVPDQSLVRASVRSTSCTCRSTRQSAS